MDDKTQPGLEDEVLDDLTTLSLSSHEQVVEIEAAETQDEKVSEEETDNQLFSKDAAVFVGFMETELWDMVLCKLGCIGTAQDVINASNASPYFRSLLMLKMPNILFPQVLDVLRNHPKYDCKNVILALRLVSSRWNSIVETEFQENHSHYRVGSDQWTPDLNTPSYCNLRLASGNQIRTFRNHFRATHLQKKNPLLGRTVSLTYPKIDHRNRNFLIHIRNFLAEYGREIYHFKLKLETCRAVPNARFRIPTAFGLVLTWMALTPNLKSAVIKYAPSSHEAEENNPLDVVLPQVRLQTFECLKVLNVPANLFNLLVTSCRNLKILDIQNAHPNYNILRNPGLMPHVKTLSLGLILPTNIFWFESSDLSAWQLKELRLLFWCKKRRFVEWSMILNFVRKHWANTLEHVEIQMPTPTTKPEKDGVFEECLSMQWKMPRLKNLTLRLPFLTPIDFLMPWAPTLEYLHIVVDEKDQVWKKIPPRVVRKQFSEFFGNADYMMKSIVWNNFPEIKSVRMTYEDADYTLVYKEQSTKDK